MSNENNDNYDVVDMFCEVTRLSRPNNLGARMGNENDKAANKWRPLVNMWEVAQKDQYEFISILQTALDNMQREGLTVANPSSIEAEFVKVANIRQANNSKREVSQAQFVAYRNKLLALGYNVLW